MSDGIEKNKTDVEYVSWQLGKILHSKIIYIFCDITIETGTPWFNRHFSTYVWSMVGFHLFIHVQWGGKFNFKCSSSKRNGKTELRKYHNEKKNCKRSNDTHKKMNKSDTLLCFMISIYFHSTLFLSRFFIVHKFHCMPVANDSVFSHIYIHASNKQPSATILCSLGWPSKKIFY